MADKLYLVDGMSHVYRAYHAIQNLTNKEGLPTNAIYGFTTMLRKLIAEEKPTYLGVAIDLSGPTVRHEQFEEYKATRVPMPEDLSVQLPYILRVCEVLRVPVLSFERYEADDVLGTLAAKAVAQGLEVVIVTIDKDMFQLVNDRVSILDTRTMTRFDAEKVKGKFGVWPHQVVDVFSLVGDVSDNIPGAPGIGEKGARQLIQESGSLENLLQNRDRVERKSYRESLQRNEELIRMSHQLLTIHKDLPLELDLSALELSEPDREAARQLFSELNFTSLLDEFVPAPEPSELSIQRFQSREGISQVATQVKGKRVAPALLTSTGNTWDAKVEGLAVAADGAGSVFYLPGSLLEESPEAVLRIVEESEELVIHDLKPLHFLALRQGKRLNVRARDTMLMAYLLNPNQSSFSLDRVALEYLKTRPRTAEEAGPPLFENAGPEVLCDRARLTLELCDQLAPRIRELKLELLLEEVEIPLVEVLAEVESHGVKVDSEFLRQMSQELEGEIESLTRRIYDIAGEEFNINSPRQLADVLFERLNLPVAKRTRKAGHFATGVEVLEELAASHEIAHLILDYRELTKLKNTYLDTLPRLVHPRTGRIHTSFNQMVAATGRLSSSNPNLQNIPIKSELGRKIRRAFVAEPGGQILAADYSQIELRVMAHLSEDPMLLDAFTRGEDVHDRTAREVFGQRSNLPAHELRRLAKVINFGVMYGLSAFGLAQNLKIDRPEAQRFIDSYFERYKGVKAWIERTREEARRRGHVTTLFGRIRQIPELRSPNRNVRSLGERTAINAPIQGTAADLIKKAMVSLQRELWNRGLKSKLVLQVHDELVFEVNEAEVEILKQLVREQMEGVAELKVPLKVDVGIGPSWYDAK